MTSRFLLECRLLSAMGFAIFADMREATELWRYHFLS
jgi:hypothetical protein